MVKKTMSLLTAITLLLAGGYYVSKDAPAVALELTWTAPAAVGCYEDADGYIVQMESDGAVVGLDTVWTNAYVNVPPPGIHRFRVLGFSVQPDGTLKTGEFMDENCSVIGGNNWSIWSPTVTVTGTVGQAGAPGIAVGVK